MIKKCESCQNGCNCKCKKYIYYFLEGILALVIIIGLAVKMTNKEVPVENIETLSDASIEIFSPLPQQSITSPLTITGKARGNWFFEGSFPVTLVDWDGLLIAEGIIQAKGEWMTEDFVPFEATLTFVKPSDKSNGFLIFTKDNPSGLSQFDDFWEVPIIFK